jgi:hypothetical protein
MRRGSFARIVAYRVLLIAQKTSPFLSKLSRR